MCKNDFLFTLTKFEEQKEYHLPFQHAILMAAYSFVNLVYKFQFLRKNKIISYLLDLAFTFSKKSIKKSFQILFDGKDFYYNIVNS